MIFDDATPFKAAFGQVHRGVVTTVHLVNTESRPAVQGIVHRVQSLIHLNVILFFLTLDICSVRNSDT